MTHASSYIRGYISGAKTDPLANMMTAAMRRRMAMRGMSHHFFS
tara:strand:- start:143 stop:274 length:132 start_codon:yes stop_codon:yes gene_type:complete